MLSEIKYGKHIQGEVVDFIQIECGGCGIPFFVPTKWQREKSNTNGSFYCPNGCSRVYTGKTHAEILQERLAQLKIEKEKSEEILQNRLA